MEREVSEEYGEGERQTYNVVLVAILFDSIIKGSIEECLEGEESKCLFSFRYDSHIQDTLPHTMDFT